MQLNVYQKIAPIAVLTSQALNFSERFGGVDRSGEMESKNMTEEAKCCTKKVIAMLVLFSTMVFAQQKIHFFTDSRDNKTYKAVKIASQIWMAENLNYAASGSECYDKKPANCTKYGRLYNWDAAMEACPSGWHLPSRGEYEALDKYVGGEKVAGKKLKARGGWSNNGNGTDEFGFAALPGGLGYADGSFGYVGDYGIWCSASEYNSGAYLRDMGYSRDSVNWGSYSYSKSYLFSVRCLQD
jgi:uncharacterized protein (TIGR02145 family)